VKTCWGSGGIAARTLNLGNRLGRVVSFTLRSLYPQDERTPSTYWIGGWAPDSVWTRWRGEKNPSPCLESNPCCSARSLVATPPEPPRRLNSELIDWQRRSSAVDFDVSGVKILGYIYYKRVSHSASQTLCQLTSQSTNQLMNQVVVFWDVTPYNNVGWNRFILLRSASIFILKMVAEVFTWRPLLYIYIYICCLSIYSIFFRLLRLKLAYECNY
jgi:hypothetical protein